MINHSWGFLERAVVVLKGGSLAIQTFTCVDLWGLLFIITYLI